MNNQKINLKYVLLGNVSNSQVVSEIVVVKDPQTQTEAKQIFEKLSKVGEKKIDAQNKIQGNKGNYFFTISSTNVFFLVLADSNYPPRFVYEMIDHINKDHIPLMVNDKGELNASGKQLLKGYVDKYQDLKGVSKIADVQGDVDEIKLEMQDNIRKMVKNVDDVNELGNKSNKIKDNAALFKNNATELKRTTWWQNCKLTIIIVVLVIGVTLAIVLPIVLKN